MCCWYPRVVVVVLVTIAAQVVGLTAQQPTVAIRGAILDSATLVPVADVAVYVDGNTLADRTDDDGSFLLTDLGLGTHALVLLRDGFSPRILRFDVSEHHQGEVDVGSVLLSPGPAPTASISGTVTDAMIELPVFGIDVSINGVTVAVTDIDGRFSFPAMTVQWGPNHLEFRRIGYAPTDAELWTAQEWTEFDLDIKLNPLALVMPEVVVEGDRTTYYFSSRLHDFERRRQSGSGSYFTRQDIEERRPYFVTDLLTLVPGVSVTPNASGSNVVRMMRHGGCMPMIYVDGMRITGVPGVDLIEQMVGPDDVAGIEVYKGPAQVPAEFSTFGSDCGVVAIWTR